MTETGARRRLANTIFQCNTHWLQLAQQPGTWWCRVRKILRAGGKLHRLHAAQQSGYGTNFPMLQICALGQFMQRYGGAMNVEGITLFIARCSIEDNEATVNSRNTFYHVIDHTDLFSRADVWWWFAH